jgi:hypothetical protein
MRWIFQRAVRCAHHSRSLGSRHRDHPSGAHQKQSIELETGHDPVGHGPFRLHPHARNSRTLQNELLLVRPADYSSEPVASGVWSDFSFRLARKAAAAPSAAAPSNPLPSFEPPLPVAGSVVTVVVPDAGFGGAGGFGAGQQSAEHDPFLQQQVPSAQSLSLQHGQEQNPSSQKQPSAQSTSAQHSRQTVPYLWLSQQTRPSQQLSCGLSASAAMTYIGLQ